jgi:hypothetical protein
MLVVFIYTPIMYRQCVNAHTEAELVQHQVQSEPTQWHGFDPGSKIKAK